MAATKLQMNWASVQHGTTAITRVDSVSINTNTTLTPYMGDVDVWPSAVVATSNAASVTIQSSDPATLMGIGPGSVGTLTATNKDAKKQTGGDIVYTIVNAVAGEVQTTGSHAQYSNATITFQCFSTDGSTNPISFTRA